MVRPGDPPPNPLKNAPPPTLPVKNKGGRPPKNRPPVTVAAAPPAANEPQTPPEFALPLDPVERERVLAEQRPLAKFVVEGLSSIADRLPPRRPLSDEEKAALQGPLEECLVKWGAPATPEGKLFVAAAGIALMRYVEFEATRSRLPKVETKTVAELAGERKPAA